LAKLPKKGLVHSFTGTLEEMKKMVDMGLDIGVNGCSLKTEENLEVVKAMPLDRIQIETDGPWVYFLDRLTRCVLTIGVVRNAPLSSICEIQGRRAASAKSREEREMGKRGDDQGSQ
jgi:Tat protein secretion system quality control protein TatD with DNase activity